MDLLSFAKGHGNMEQTEITIVKKLAMYMYCTSRTRGNGRVAVGKKKR